MNTRGLHGPETIDQADFLPHHDVVPEQASIYRAYPDLGNPELPVYNYKDILIDAMNRNQVVIVVSPTGTGKSTQLPQYALEAGFTSVTLTQPRRRAAQNVAERISEELGNVFGEARAGQLVSYQTGAGLTGTKGTPIKVMTEGVLVAKDTYEPTSGDNELWILDEYHEKTNDMFLLAGIAKQRQAANPNFTFVVTTATADLEETVAVLTDEMGQEPAVIVLENPTGYTIEHHEKPDSNVVKEAVKAAVEIHENPDGYGGSKGIQVFRRGKREIKDTIDEIRSRLPAEVMQKTVILQNHAKLTPTAQQPVYSEHDGIKIVVQTNVAKTSMTQPGTRYVITDGVERMNVLDEEGTVGLFEKLSSQDCMVQMKGRTGRTNNGIFIETPATGEKFTPMSGREPHLQPEILRSSVHRVAFLLAMRGENIREFVSFCDIPKNTLDIAIKRLQDLGVMDEQEKITRLGHRMSKYPVSPEHALMMVAAEEHSELVRCQVATMVACAEVGGIRLYEKDRGRNWQDLTDESTSDLIAQLDIYLKSCDKKAEEMDLLDLDVNNMVLAGQLLRKLARRAKIAQLPEIKPPNQAEREILRSCIISGFKNSVYVPVGGTAFKKLGVRLKIRELSDRSVVNEFTRDALIGTARNVEVVRGGSRQTLNILEDNTEISLRQLGAVAPERSEWVTVNYGLRKGKVVAIQEQVLGTAVIDRREVLAEASPQVRAKVINMYKVMETPTVRELQTIKARLEELQHRTKTPISKLTQDDIDIWIAKCAPSDVTAPGTIESLLRNYVRKEKISLRSYLSEDDEISILANSPNEVLVGEVTIKVRYVSGKVIARKQLNADTVDLLPDDAAMLSDGREIFFMYEDKPHTLAQLKRKLQLVNNN